MKQVSCSSSKTRFRLTLLGVAAFSLFLIAPAAFLTGGGTQNAAAQKGGAAQPGGAAQKGGTGATASITPIVGRAVAFGVTPPVSTLGEAKYSPNKESILLGKGAEDREVNELNEAQVKSAKKTLTIPKSVDPLIQKGGLTVEPKIPSPSVSFDGVSSDDNLAAFGGRVLPPDTNGAVGPSHYVQTVNLLVGIYNKAGTLLVPKFKMSSLFASIGAPCNTRDDGDPVVVYDSLADRWLLSQFCTVANPNNHQLIAISKTGDPTGAYFVYDFMMPNNKFNDYPKFGVWPDAYYMSDNQFNQAGTAFLGAGAFAFNRKKMLVGDPTATFIYFDIFNIDPDAGGMLPTNFVGNTPPPIGLVNTFWEWRADEFGDPLDALRPYDFHADFAVPASSTLTVRPDIAISAFDARQPPGRGDIEQPSPGVNLDAIPDRMMHLANYRVLPGGLHSYVMNFTVNVSGVNPTSSSLYQTGIRWCEVRRSGGGAFSLNQEGTYNHNPISGSTGENLWMGSVAQDNNGDIALGFSRSSTTVFPTISYAGRLVGDPAGQLSQGEADLIVGTGAQRSTSSRWGDYSAMTVDPIDGCAFWYTQEYYTAAGQAASTAAWQTRIGAFKFTQCTNEPVGTINGTITNCNTGLPLQNAVIMTPEGFFRQTSATGQFSMQVAPGTYNVMVSGPAGAGFGTCNQMVTVSNLGTATVNCCLAASPIIESAGATLATESCTPPNGVLDPNEQVTVSFCVQNTGAANTSMLTGTLQNTGGVTGASGPQNYGALVAGGPAVCRNFTFLVNGTCGGTVTATIHFMDGATDLGNVTYTFQLGVLNTIFAENFDGVVAPALPAGWTTSFVNGDGDCTVGGPLCTLGSNWTTVNTSSDTALNSAFHDDPSCVTDNFLVSPTFMTAVNNPQLMFRHQFTLESTFDGGVLEISLNGGAFNDVGAGNFTQGGYTGTISTLFLSPIAGRQAWTGSSGGYQTVVCNLPATAGQNVQLRWRFASDCNVSSTGWNVDTIKITGGFVCSTTCPPPPTCTGITCPANQTRCNDPNQCGAVVTYPAPTPNGSGCGAITCTPASGSFFPKGTTTVSCDASGTGANPDCTFTVTVNDCQPPTITCPPNQTAVTDQSICLPPGQTPCKVVNFTATASDNCPGVTVVCNPPSGSCLPVGATTVACTATDASNNTATCSFTVTVFDVCLQDDSNPTRVLLFNSFTGDYRFCCGGTTYTGRGKVTTQGCVVTLEHNPIDRRVRGTADKAAHAGNASLQAPPGKTRCTITDGDLRNNTCTCQ